MLRSLALFALLCAPAAIAQQPDKPAPVKASLVSEVSAAAPGKPFRVAVKLEHGPAYHTYGKTLAPDVVGKPTALTWELPPGWKMDELEWPATHKVPSTDGKDTEGYARVVHLPAQITPPADAAPGSKATLKVNLDALVCDPKSCMPVNKDLSIEIPVEAEAKVNEAAKDAFPAQAAPAGAKSGGTDAPGIKKKDAGTGNLFLNLLYAFIGGLILNIMPCVFPVLGVKIVGVVQQAGEDRAKVVKHGFAYTAGVIISFWVIAALIIALGGGWAEQFRLPAFVFGISVFFLVFGLNMFGVFEIGASAVGIGSELTAKSGLGGSFFSGLLATVVSTPCSAPFLGTALAYALGLPPVQSLAFFTVIGLGLASPYLLLSFFPDLVKMLPRPGAWMESFKQFMSFLLFGTLAYFVWTLAGQLGDTEFRDALFALVLVGMACWAYGRWTLPHLKSSTRAKGYAVTALAFALAMWLGWPRPAAKSADDLEWIPWTPELVTMHHVDLKEPVYIDFTARWCATCQVNKRVYKDREVKALLKEHKVVLLKADWTNPDPRIDQALFDLKKAAVPVNVLYIPGEKEPHVLPENLTVSNVKEALSKLKKKE